MVINRREDWKIIRDDDNNNICLAWNEIIKGHLIKSSLKIRTEVSEFMLGQS